MHPVSAAGVTSHFLHTLFFPQGARHSENDRAACGSCYPVTSQQHTHAHHCTTDIPSMERPPIYTVDDDDLLLDLLKDDDTADRHRERLQEMLEYESIAYVASPPRPPSPTPSPTSPPRPPSPTPSPTPPPRPPSPTPSPTPPPTPPPAPMRRVFRSESGHGYVIPSPVRKAPVPEDEIIR